MDVTGAGALFMSAEYAVKAVIVEHYGFLPPSFETHRIVNLSHRIALWPQLPSDLRTHLADMALLDPNVRYPRETAYETLVSSASRTGVRGSSRPVTSVTRLAGGHRASSTDRGRETLGDASFRVEARRWPPLPPT